MKNALSKWNFSNEINYESAILALFTNNHKVEAKQMFNDMPLQKRKDFVKNCLYYWNKPKKVSIFFFNILLDYSK